MGMVSKEDFAATLRAHQAAADALKAFRGTKQKQLMGMNACVNDNDKQQL